MFLQPVRFTIFALSTLSEYAKVKVYDTKNGSIYNKKHGFILRNILITHSYCRKYIIIPTREGEIKKSFFSITVIYVYNY